MSRTVAINHNKDSEHQITRTVAPKHNTCKNGISRTLSPLEELDIKLFGKILDDGFDYFRPYTSISRTTRL